MNGRKFGLIVGVMLVLAIALVILRAAGNKDETRPQLESILLNNHSITELANEAAQKASLFEVQTKAATLAVTATSDNNQIKAYYKDHFGKDYALPKAEDEDLKKLQDSEPGGSFDELYKTLVRGELETNLAVLKALYNSSTNQQLRDIIKVNFNNQSSALEQLN